MSDEFTAQSENQTWLCFEFWSGSKMGDDSLGMIPSSRRSLRADKRWGKTQRTDGNLQFGRVVRGRLGLIQCGKALPYRDLTHLY